MKPGTFLHIHRWIALAFAPLLLLQALTGAALIFHQPLARLIDPGAMIRQSDGAAEVPVSTLVEAAQERWSGLRVTRLFLPAGNDAVAFAHLFGKHGESRYAAIDPGDGQVLAAGTVWRFPLEAALQVHFRLMGDWRGIAIVALNGLGLLLIGASGVSHWWPGRGRIIASLKVRKALPGRIKLRLYHRSAGAVASLLVLFSAGTGLLLAATDLPWGPAAPAPTRIVTLDGPRIDAAIGAIDARFPDARIRDVRFAQDGTLAINLFAPRSGARAVDVVRVDATAPRLTGVLPAEENPALWLTILPLHAGDVLGLPGRLLLLAEAFALVFLCISGPLSWWRGRKARTGAKR